MIIIIAIIILILLYSAYTYNRLVRGRNKVAEGFSTMDVFMRKRFDLIPRIVETVKAYAKHESETLQYVAQQRTIANNINAKIGAETQIAHAMNGVIVQAEAYPELKANENFLELQKKLKEVETDIANARKYFNGCVRQYNTVCEVFPSNIIASICQFKRMSMYNPNEAIEVGIQK